MFDLVPFAGSGWEVADGDLQSGLGGQGGEFGLPQAGAVSVGAAAVGGDQQPARVGGATLPTAAHQERIVLTANAAVSWSVPTLTQPASAPMS